MSRVTHSEPGLPMLCAGYLVLLSGNVSLNPGPANGLDDVVKLRGLKFIHQNIQSLGDKINSIQAGAYK